MDQSGWRRKKSVSVRTSVRRAIVSSFDSRRRPLLPLHYFHSFYLRLVLSCFHALSSPFLPVKHFKKVGVICKQRRRGQTDKRQSTGRMEQRREQTTVVRVVSFLTTRYHQVLSRMVIISSPVSPFCSLSLRKEDVSDPLTKTAATSATCHYARFSSSSGSPLAAGRRVRRGQERRCNEIRLEWRRRDDIYILFLLLPRDIVLVLQ